MDNRSEIPSTSFIHYAHTLPGTPESKWERLEHHLIAVATSTQDFASIFGAGAIGQLAGLWHDIGKGSIAFQQNVLRAGSDESLADDEGRASTPRQRVDHSTAGAQHANKTLGPLFGKVLAYVIAAHHGRLADWDRPGSNAVLPKRLTKGIEAWQAPPGVSLGFAEPNKLMPSHFANATTTHETAFQLAFFTRMIYSALIDADRLETECFCDKDAAAMRPNPSETPRPADLLEQLNTFIDSLRAKRASDPSPVDRERDAVLAACRARAENKPGLFSLTVPTGGGKTLASLAFALTHAKTHGMRRVVYALPFTSIIEQTAATFSNIFPQEGVVLEHHSGFDTAMAFDSSDQRRRYEMMAENWDAPIVVTTNNQLFESLFSAHGSTCRKLHRLTNSVIVLDEAQAIPPRLLKPTLAALRELTLNYRCTVVLCTATQPALEKRDSFEIGLDNVREIVDEPEALYERMRRVRVQHLGDEPIEDDLLNDHLAAHDAALCIVNTRKHAAALAGLLTEKTGTPTTHLSAALCPAHRRQLVADIKQRLRDKQPCHVVSTQVIEAGVDVDFPVVYRAIAGFDSIAQAAGRCNREGRLSKDDPGEVFVFETEHQPSLSMGPMVAAARSLLPDHPDPLALDAIHAYFKQVYWRHKEHGKKAWDTNDVMSCFQIFKSQDAACRFNFRQADERFQWIDSQTTPILVPFGEGAGLIEHLQSLGEGELPDWPLLRQVQQFSVSVYDNQLAQLIENTAVTSCCDGCFWVLNNPKAYDPTLGLRLDVVGWDAGAMVV